MDFVICVDNFSVIILFLFIRYNGCTKSFKHTVASEFKPDDIVLNIKKKSLFK